MPADLNTALVNLSTQIANKAATATAEELAYLSKAVEGIGGKANVLDIQILSDQRKSEITALGDAKKNEVIDLTTSKKDEIVTLTGAKKTEITDLATAKKTDFDTNAAAKKADFNATAASADLTTRATNLEGRATATEAKTASFQSDLPNRKSYAASASSLTLTASDFSGSVEIDGPRTLDFTIADLVLPDATLLALYVGREVALKNRTLASVRVRANGGAILGVIPPYGFGRLGLASAASAPGLWRLTVLTAPSARERLNISAPSSLSHVYAEFEGWPTGSGIFGAASYSDNVVAIPHLDDAGTSLKVALLTSVYQTNNGYRGFLIAPARLDGGGTQPSDWGYAMSNTSYTWSGNGVYWNAAPVRGGIVTFGVSNASGQFEAFYIRPPYTAKSTLIQESYSGTAAPYYATAMTFGDGQFVVFALFNGSAQFVSLRRFRLKADGTAEAAGSITLPQTGASVYPISDTRLALSTNGASLSIFDVTQAGTAWTPTVTGAAFPFVASGMENRIAFPVGRDSILASDGAYQFDGVQTFTKMAGGAGYIMPGAGRFTTSSFTVIACQGAFLSTQGPIWYGYSQSWAYFFETDGTFASRTLERVVGDGQRYANPTARVTPLGGDMIFTSFSWVYGVNTSQSAGMRANVTSLSRVAPGNIGLAGLGRSN